MLTAVDMCMVNDSVRYAAELGLVYLNNPKAACSTIKYSLWQAIDVLNGRTTFDGDLHGRSGDPFVTDVFALKPDETAKMAVASAFSVVRNPFSRILAAYRDKIPDDPAVWTIFRRRLGLRATLTKDDLPFPDFARLVAVAHPNLLDGHFRPQCDNLLLPFFEPSFIGHLENILPIQRFLAERSIRLCDIKAHATGSSERLANYYDLRSIEAVSRKYADDFALFGYCDDISTIDAIGGHTKLPPGRSGNHVMRWITSGETPAGTCDALKAHVTVPPGMDRDEALVLIANALPDEHNWSRLRRFARFIGDSMPKSELQNRIRDNMTTLRKSYESEVTNPAIFIENLPN